MGGDFQALWDWLNKNSAAVTAMAAVVAAAVTAIYSFFTILLWFATRRQAEITRQIFDASHIPYLSIRVEDATDMSEKGVLSFNLILENQGTVLAHIMKWELRGILTDLELKTYDLTHIDLLHSPADGTLVPGQKRIIQPRFYDERLTTTDLSFRLVVMVAYQGMGPSTYVTDFEAYGQSGKWHTQDCTMRTPQHALWVAMGYKHW
jgi:hypothetical protein